MRKHDPATMKPMQPQANRNRRIRTAIDDVAFGGEGVGRVEGKTVFVPFTIDGEQIEATIIERKKRFDRARLGTVIVQSPDRIEPACEYFGHCGGCDYQHIAYHHQLEIKHRQVRQLLERIGKLPQIDVLPTVACPSPFGFRNRITVHSAGGRIGFFEKNSRTVVDVKRCAIALPAVNRELEKLRATGLSDGKHRTLRAPEVSHTFTQTNDFVAAALFDYVAQKVKGESLLDAYCGSGFFAHPLAKTMQIVIGIDWNENAIESARKTALPNENYVCDDVGAAIESLIRENRPQTVILDPSADGIEDRVVRALTGDPPPRLIYVSCNPAALARDLAGLKQFYHIREIQPFDMFPQTAEIETVAVLDP
jgi:tRNA/tmRNA/rRNA uracil-C5-methylase (TrmA/RlmC/RlmD family)